MWARRKHGREYNEKKREREYYDNYRTTVDRRESTSTMASRTTSGTFIIMRTSWQCRNASRSLNFVSLCIQFGNVAMYQNYIHVIEKYVVLIHRMFLKKSFITNKTVIYRRLHFLSLGCVGWTISYAFQKKCDGGDETEIELGHCYCISHSDGPLLQRFPSMYDFMRFYVLIQNEFYK